MAKAGKTGAADTDGDLIARAYRKIMNGQQDELSATEKAAVKRHEKEKEERLRWQYYESIPQKHWRRMSGRQTKVLNEQAQRYGIPFGGPSINLPAVVRALHDFLAENKYKLAREDDELMNGGASPALERYREERAALARLDRLEREGELLPRDAVRLSLGKTAAILRTAGETLQRQFGQPAADILIAAVDDAEHEISRHFGAGAATQTDDAPPDGEVDGPE